MLRCVLAFCIFVGHFAEAFPANAADEEIATIKIVCRTGADDKECGVFAVEVYNGAKRILRNEYGDGQDWNNGYILEDSLTQQQIKLTDETIRVITYLEERPGQKNITWDAVIEIEIETNRGRKLVFQGNRRFDTDNNKPKHTYDMGSQKFKT